MAMIDEARLPDTGSDPDLLSLVFELVQSNNDQERRLLALEPAQGILQLDPVAVLDPRGHALHAAEPKPLAPVSTLVCQCKEPFPYLGGKNCLTCYKLIGQQ